MATNNLPKVFLNELKARGVQSLADRPNEAAAYGTGGLSAKQLKEHFDAAVIYLAEKFNALLSLIGTADFLREIRWSEVGEEAWRLPDKDGLMLSDVKSMMQDGGLAELLAFESGSGTRRLAEALRSMLTFASAAGESIESQDKALKDLQEAFQNFDGGKVEINDLDKFEIAQSVLSILGETGGGDYGSGRWVFKNKLCREGTYSGDPEEKLLVGVSYTCFVNGEKIATITPRMDGQNLTFYEEGGRVVVYVFHYPTTGEAYWSFSADSGIKSGLVSVWAQSKTGDDGGDNGGGEDNGNEGEDDEGGSVVTGGWLFNGESLDTQGSYLGAPREGDSFTVYVEGEMLATQIANWSGGKMTFSRNDYWIVAYEDGTWQVKRDGDSDVYAVVSVWVGEGAPETDESEDIDTGTYTITLSDSGIATITPVPAKLSGGLIRGNIDDLDNAEDVSGIIEMGGTTDFSDYIKNAGGGSYFVAAVAFEYDAFGELCQSSGMLFSNVITVEGVGGDDGGNWLFEDEYLTTEWRDDLPTPVEGVSYTIFVGDEEKLTKVYEKHVPFSWLDGSIYYEPDNGWQFYFDPPEGYMTESGTVSIRINNADNDGGNWLFKDENLDKYRSDLPAPVEGVSYTVFVDGEEKVTSVCDRIPFTLGWDDGAVAYFDHQGWGFYFDPPSNWLTETGMVSIRINNADNDGGNWLFEDEWITDDTANSPDLPAPVAGVSYTCFVNGGEIGTGICDGSISFHTDDYSVYLVYAPDMGWLFYPIDSQVTSGYVSIRDNTGEKYTITFPTQTYKYGNVFAGNNAILRVSLADGVSVDGGKVHATLYDKGGTNCGTKELTIATGGSVEFDFEGFNGEMVSANDYHSVEVSFSIDGENITQTHGCNYP